MARREKFLTDTLEPESTRYSFVVLGVTLQAGIVALL